MREELFNKLKYCKLSGIIDSFDGIYNEVLDKEIGHLEFLEMLLDEEVIHRENMSAGILKNALLRYYSNSNKKVEVKKSFHEYAQRLKKGPINIDSNACIKEFELERFNKNIIKQNKAKSLELVNTTVRLKLENTIEQLEPRYAWSVSYKIFMRLLYHTFGLEELSAAILVTNRKSSTNSFFDTIGEFLDLLPISDYKEPKKGYKDIEILLDKMAKNHISFIEFVYYKENEENYGDIKQMFGKIKDNKLQLPIFNYVGLFDEVTIEQFTTYEQKEFTAIVDVVCYKTELVIKGFCLKGKEELLSQKLQRDLAEIFLHNICLDNGRGI